MAFRRFILSITLILGGVLHATLAQTSVSLGEVSRRQGPDLEAAHLGEKLVVRGVVASRPVQMAGYLHTVIQDETGAGLTLILTSDQATAAGVGTQLEAVGVLEERAGLPVLRPSSLRVLGRGDPPAAQVFSVTQANTTANLGRYVSVRGRIRGIGQNSGGEVMSITDGDREVQIFYPWTGRKRQAELSSWRAGDLVQVTGISSQYCPVPPFDRGYEIIVDSGDAITLVSAGWLISPRVVSNLLGAMVGILLVWWIRERNLKRQRRILREIMSLAEDVIAAPSMAEIARRMEAMPPESFGAPEVEIYVHTEGSEALDRVLTDKARTPLSIPLDIPIGSLQALAAVCFRNRAMLAISNLPRSPLIHDSGSPLPKSAAIAPMVAQGQLVGVLSLLYRRKADLNPDFQLAIQHLANQVAASLKLQDQQLMKEQLLRSEKMAAAGQLISGVAADLRVPLTHIETTARCVDENGQVANSGIREIVSEARRGIELVNHLLSFSNMERREPRSLDVHALMSRLVDLRSTEQGRKGIVTINQMPVSPVEVWADEAQLEQALLTVLVHAEQAATASPTREIQIHSRILGARVQIAFECAAPVGAARVEEPGPADYFGFPVAQAILQSHGGDLRNVAVERGVSRLEVELPVLAPAAAAGDLARRGDKPSRVLTALVVDPDVIAQRRLTQLMAVRGHRVIPVSTPEEAADLVQRMQFDVLFCATRVSGLTWVELYQRVRRRIGVFALMTEGYDPDTAQAFGNGEGQVLSKPIEERELDQTLGVVEVRWAVSRP